MEKKVGLVFRVVVSLDGVRFGERQGSMLWYTGTRLFSSIFIYAHEATSREA